MSSVNNKHLVSLALVECILLAKFSLISSADMEESQEKEASREHKLNSVLFLLLFALLVITVLTIWLFKVKRFRFLHETGLSIFYGIIIGAIMKYGITLSPRSFYSSNCNINPTALPTNLWVTVNGSRYSYKLTGPVNETKKLQPEDNLEEKAVFNPEIFFNVLLPPIIFYAGYDMKKRYFFRNIGAILTYAFVGTTISSIVFGSLIYGFVKFQNIQKFDYVESLSFGALVSATDPVTVLAIFHDMHVDVDLYALVFGESVMNDAVAIVLYRSINSYSSNSGDFKFTSLLSAIGVFVGVFGGSFMIGTLMALVTSLLTKFTNIRDFPLLETALFFLMSWSTFLMAEAAGLTGIVAVLFCGISQAHYTYDNLSEQSKQQTKQTFGLLNFLAENFIFSYIGLSVFTFSKHKWDIGFICWSFLALLVSRFFNIYPLSFLLNLGRKRKISAKFQHMMFFAGLRGAVAFALAIRNTSSLARQMMLSTVLMIVLITVVINGGSTMSMLTYLKIKVGVDPDDEGFDDETSFHREGDVTFPERRSYYERVWLFRLWYNFDKKYMKPLFTKAGPPLSETLPACCAPLANFLSQPNIAEAEAQGAAQSASNENFDSETSYERGDGREDRDQHISVDQVTADSPGDIEMTEGDLGLGDRTFNPRS
ncbi:sodium/hydrogen exchanger 7-like isoform X2 [Xenia sp. Carnegie-2017]|uniref:sodium/hydrogen exchanger 7-like isoform X2 n=1 Tax=Xenia sp. Carnegie-2017 TaxID=2897299 RepID=UPI001F04744D|nr:sodium/hydrogen exchanger 7-like isoform X2 [Xenia sp. Carnegie-2017]